jgi:catechol 2,3-dioxygenase-like lactoylglutathione lyase family enzyme
MRLDEYIRVCVSSNVFAYANVMEDTLMSSGKAVNVLKAHLAIKVRDVERSIEFYRKMFGIEPSKVRSGYAKFDVQTPPLNFTLNQVLFNDSGALSHMGSGGQLAREAISGRFKLLWFKLRVATRAADCLRRSFRGKRIGAHRHEFSSRGRVLLPDAGPLQLGQASRGGQRSIP